MSEHPTPNPTTGQGEPIAEQMVRSTAHTIWRQLVVRNQWQLITDEEQLLDEVTARHGQTPPLADGTAHIRATLYAIYSERLYRGMLDREERAAHELWLMFIRLATRSGTTEHDAHDHAQEVVTRILAKIDQVTSPRSFLSWAMKLFRTTQRDLRPKPPFPSSLPETDDPMAITVDPIAHVEEQLFTQELRDLLHAALPNGIERLTLLRWVVRGDFPRDIARDLGLPLHQTRVAKSRALQRLRANTAFMSIMRSLNYPQQLPPRSGGSCYA